MASALWVPLAKSPMTGRPAWEVEGRTARRARRRQRCSWPCHRGGSGCPAAVKNCWASRNRGTSERPVSRVQPEQLKKWGQASWLAGSWPPTAGGSGPASLSAGCRAAFLPLKRSARCPDLFARFSLGCCWTGNLAAGAMATMGDYSVIATLLVARRCVVRCDCHRMELAPTVFTL